MGQAKEIGTVGLHPNTKLENGLSRLDLPRTLQGVRRALALLGEQGKVKSFFNNVVNADKLSGLVEDIRDAMIDYQVRASDGPFLPCLTMLLDINATRHVRQEPPTRRESRLITSHPRELTGG